MTLGMSTLTATAYLNASFNNTSYAVTQAYVKLHVGDPGSAGTANAAVETTRKAVSFGTPTGTSTVTIANDVAVTWTTIAGSEDASHFSLWDAVSGGNYLGSGLNTAGAYVAGDTYDVAIGALTVSLSCAA